MFSGCETPVTHWIKLSGEKESDAFTVTGYFSFFCFSLLLLSFSLSFFIVGVGWESKAKLLFTASVFCKMNPWMIKQFLCCLLFKWELWNKASHSTAMSLKQAAWVYLTLAEYILYLKCLSPCNMMSPLRTTFCSCSVNCTPTGVKYIQVNWIISWR